MGSHGQEGVPLNIRVILCIYHYYVSNNNVCRYLKIHANHGLSNRGREQFGLDVDLVYNDTEDMIAKNI